MLSYFISQRERLVQLRRQKALVRLLSQFDCKRLMLCNLTACNHLLQRRKKDELDVEVASMIEMAETASMKAGSLKRSSQEEATSSQSETSLTKSTENLIPNSPSVSLQKVTHFS